jgi:hypothetical protein
MKWILLLLVVSCDEEGWYGPFHKCLKAETYTYTTMMMVGKVMIPQMHTGTRCEIESKEFYMSKGEEEFELVKR